MNNIIRVSYGQSEDEFVEINSLSDELRFSLCMRLYKTHTTMVELEKAIKAKSLVKIKMTR